MVLTAAPMGPQELVLRAAAALAHGDRELAVAALRSQLSVMAGCVGGTADWSTLTLIDPDDEEAVARVTP